MKLSFAELHVPAFLAGTNLGSKLEVKNTAKGKFELDLEVLELSGYKQVYVVISHKGKKLYVPESNVVGFEIMTEGTVTGAIEQPKVLQAKGKKSAQVSGPHDHVFANGAGRTHD